MDKRIIGRIYGSLMMKGAIFFLTILLGTRKGTHSNAKSSAITVTMTKNNAIAMKVGNVQSARFIYRLMSTTS